MVDKLCEGISEKITQVVGDRYSVYTEAVYQGLKKPCIFVECEKMEKIQLLGGRYFLRVSVKVTVDSATDTKKHDVGSITGELFEALGSAMIEDVVLHGKNITGKWETDVFVLRCFYDVFTKCEEGEGALMDSIIIRQELDYGENKG